MTAVNNVIALEKAAYLHYIALWNKDVRYKHFMHDLRGSIGSISGLLEVIKLEELTSHNPYFTRMQNSVEKGLAIMDTYHSENVALTKIEKRSTLETRFFDLDCGTVNLSLEYFAQYALSAALKQLQLSGLDISCAMEDNLLNIIVTGNQLTTIYADYHYVMRSKANVSEVQHFTAEIALLMVDFIMEGQLKKVTLQDNQSLHFSIKTS